MKNDVKCAAKLPDYRTVNQEDLGRKVELFGSAYKKADYKYEISQYQVLRVSQRYFGGKT